MWYSFYTYHRVDIGRELLVDADSGVGGVQVVGERADDEACQHDEQGDGHPFLLRQDDVLLQSGVLLQPLGVCPDLTEHARVAEGQDDEGDEDVGHLKAQYRGRRY